MKTHEYIVLDVLHEVEEAISNREPMPTLYEAYGRIRESFDAFWAEVHKMREGLPTEPMRKELIQTAALCCRAIYDLQL